MSHLRGRIASRRLGALRRLLADEHERSLLVGRLERAEGLASPGAHAGHAGALALPAFFHRRALEGRRAPLLLDWFERRVQTDAATRIHNAARLAALARDHGDEVLIFNAHDPVLFDRARAAPRPAREPAEWMAR